MNIQNSSDHTLSASAQNAIRNAAINCGVDGVVAVHANDNTDDEPIFDIYEETEDEATQNYLFSIDTDVDVIFER